jgi:hypothetical protein
MAAAYPEAARLTPDVGRGLSGTDPAGMLYQALDKYTSGKQTSDRQEMAVSKGAGGADGNGSDGERPAGAATASQSMPRPRDLRQARFAVSFSQVIAVLMRDPNFRNMRLADLESLVLPPVMSGQFRLAQMPTQRKGNPQGTAAKG